MTKITLKLSNNATNDIKTVYFDSGLFWYFEPITVINQIFNLNKVYETLKHRLDIWSERGSGWIVDKIENIKINIANYEPLAGSNYIPLPPELNNSMKGLINLKNKDDEWCHIIFINPTNSHPERIKKQDKKIASTLDYKGIKFPLKARDYEIVEERFNINVNVFGYENKVFTLYILKKSNEQVLNVLLISKEEKPHYLFFKDFNRLMYSKTKHKDTKHVCMSCLQNFTATEILNSHKERCLLINETQAVKYETGIVKFKSYDKQIPVALKIYADTECLLKIINIEEGKHTKLY